MAFVNIPRQTPPLLHPHQRCDNGRLVMWSTEQQIDGGLNHVARWHTKTLFTRLGQVRSIRAKSGAGITTRWRLAFHTGPFARRLRIAFVAASSDTTRDALVSFKLGGGGGDVAFHFGAGASSSTNVPNTLGYAVRTLDVDPDTEYDATFLDVDDGRLVGACVYEESLASDDANGYRPQLTAVQSPILQERAAALAMADDLWNRGGAHCFSWTSDDDAGGKVHSSTTDVNLIDTSVTTVTAKTPGMVLDLRYKGTRMSGGVPVRFRACGLTAGGGTGHVYVKNSAGTVVATININSGSESWYTADALLPATEAKYDLHLDGDGTHNTTVYAAVGYEHNP